MLARGPWAISLDRTVSQIMWEGFLASFKKPKKITSTKLEKYIAKVSHTAALTEVYVDWLTCHIGHAVRVHREFY